MGSGHGRALSAPMSDASLLDVPRARAAIRQLLPVCPKLQQTRLVAPAVSNGRTAALTGDEFGAAATSGGTTCADFSRWLVRQPNDTPVLAAPQHHAAKKDAETGGDLYASPTSRPKPALRS
jgi:hypothetical protein